jgi:hypothetical protein
MGKKLIDESKQVYPAHRLRQSDLKMRSRKLRAGGAI